MEAPLMHLALVGTPNSGKTSLFNALTGSRQKVANYPGVTVERKEGFFVTPAGRQVSLVDLPGTYSLRGRSPDEEITRDFVLGKARGEALPDLVLCVADSTNLRLTIRLLLELKSAGRPLGAVALARALAKAEQRVVLVDLRGDGADTMTMGEDHDLPGFTDLFAGEASFAQVIFRDRKSRVHLIPSGRERLRGGEIDSARLDTILDALDHTYDYVIVDAANDMLEVFGPSTGVAVVVSEFGAADPRTVRAFDRITAVSSANILLLVVDPTPASAVDEPADVATPTGAAA